MNYSNFVSIFSALCCIVYCEKIEEKTENNYLEAEQKEYTEKMNSIFDLSRDILFGSDSFYGSSSLSIFVNCKSFYINNKFKQNIVTKVVLPQASTIKANNKVVSNFTDEGNNDSSNSNDKYSNASRISCWCLGLSLDSFHDFFGVKAKYFLNFRPDIDRGDDLNTGLVYYLPSKNFYQENASSKDNIVVPSGTNVNTSNIECFAGLCLDKFRTFYLGLTYESTFLTFKRVANSSSLNNIESSSLIVPEKISASSTLVKYEKNSSPYIIVNFPSTLDSELKIEDYLFSFETERSSFSSSFFVFKFNF